MHDENVQLIDGLRLTGAGRKDNGHQQSTWICRTVYAELSRSSLFVKSFATCLSWNVFSVVRKFLRCSSSCARFAVEKTFLRFCKGLHWYQQVIVMADQIKKILGAQVMDAEQQFAVRFWPLVFTSVLRTNLNFQSTYDAYAKRGWMSEHSYLGPA